MSRSFGWSTVERWLMDEGPQHWAVLCRIGFGLMLFACYLSYLPWAQELFGPEGIGGIESQIRLFGADVYRPSAIEFLSALRGTRSMGLVWLAYATVLVASLCFSAGYMTRTAGVAMLVLNSALVARNSTVFWGWPFMFNQYLLYVVLANPGRYVSVDALLRRRRRDGDASPEPRVGTGPLWPRRLLQINICTLYAMSGFDRLHDDGWLQGGMIFVALTYDMYTRMDIDWFAFKPLLQATQYSVMALEPLASLLLWYPRIGQWLVVGLIGMHVGLEITTRVGWWQYTMVIALLSFWPQSWLEWFIRPPAHSGIRAEKKQHFFAPFATR